MRVNNSSLPLSKWVGVRLDDASNSSCTAPGSMDVLQVLELVAKAALTCFVMVCCFVCGIAGVMEHASQGGIGVGASSVLRSNLAQASISTSLISDHLSLSQQGDCGHQGRPELEPVLAPPVIDCNALVIAPLTFDHARSLPTVQMSFEL